MTPLRLLQRLWFTACIGTGCAAVAACSGSDNAATTPPTSSSAAGPLLRLRPEETGSMAALFVGTLRVDGKLCARVEAKDGLLVNAVWPAGTTVDSDGLLLTDGRLIRRDTEISLGGGSAELSILDIMAEEPTTLALECLGNADRVFVVGVDPAQSIITN
jgi:hypothetical protein